MAPRMIPIWIGKAMPVVTLLLVTLVSLPAESATKKAPPKGTGNPFDLLNGYWSGGGTVAPGKGNPEKVSCTVTYNVAGSAVTQNMRCASTDYKFNTASKLTYSGGKINGSWSETTYDAAGSVNGTAAGNTVQAIISGDKFSGRMSINVSGLSHTMHIVQVRPEIGLLSAGRERFASSLDLTRRRPSESIVSRERRRRADGNAHLGGSLCLCDSSNTQRCRTGPRKSLVALWAGALRNCNMDAESFRSQETKNAISRSRSIAQSCRYPVSKFVSKLMICNAKVRERPTIFRP
jgi:hypothetical protein